MGKALALAAVTFIALGTYYNGTRAASEMETRRRVSNGQYEAISRGAALAGINVAKQNIAEKKWGQRAFQGSHQGGQYGTSILTTPKRAKVTSVGTIKNAGRHSENYKIEIELERRVQYPKDPPVWMQYAIATDNDIAFKGDAGVYLSVYGEEGAEMNANIHTNGSMDVTGNSVEIEGFGSYSGTISGNNADNAFNPNYNPTNLPGHYQSDPVPIPDFSDVDYQNFTDAYGNSYVDQTTTGPLELSGNYSFGGTREDPYVWYISGDVTVTGNTTIDGYAIFVVDGQVQMNNDFLAGDSGYTGGTESSLALYTSGDLHIGGNTSVDAQMFVGGNAVVAKGTPTITGNIVVKGSVDLRGTPNVQYRPASSAMTSFWQGYEYTYHVIGYHEQ